MSKAVLISIHPEWREKIINGQKTIVRKTRPKIETPFKCYIYETKAINHHSILVDLDGEQRTVFEKGSGKIIGEFICERVEKYGEDTEYGKYYMSEDECRNACLTNGDISYYAQGKDIYCWYISDLAIYDKPRELKEFYKQNPCGAYSPIKDICDLPIPCVEVPNLLCRGIRLTRPPQSWCYVEEL